MISAWHVLWIVPVAAGVGIFVLAVFVGSK